MKILIVNELGSGRDSQHRISVITRIIKESYPDSIINLFLKRPRDEKFISKRFIEKVSLSPTEISVRAGTIPTGQSLLSRIFDSPEKIVSIKDAWMKILSDEKPSLVIADNAPVVRIVCDILQIKCIGTGTENFFLKTKPLSDADFTFHSKISKILYKNGDPELLASKSASIAMGVPNALGDADPAMQYAYFDTDKEDDGGLNLDVFAYIKQEDPLKDLILSALDEINLDMGKSVLVIMPNVSPLLYRPNFEITPNFVKLQGALFNSPLCINNFNYGMMLESIKSGSPSWGIPHTHEQIANRKAYRLNVNHSVTAKSMSSVKDDLIRALNEKDLNQEDVKKLWARGQKHGMQPLSVLILDMLKE
jgi:hypothetical protein